MRWVRAIVCVVLLVAGHAFAGYRPFTFTYDTYPMKKGDLEFEQWVTYSTHKEEDSGFNRLRLREEIEYGLTDDIRVALYAPNWSWENSQGRRDVRVDSLGFEAIWLLSNPVTDPIGVGLYTEVTVGEHDLELEGKLLLHKDVGQWTFAYNLIAETEWEDIFDGGETQTEGVLGHTVGVSYGLSPAWRAGGEVIVESVFEDWSDYEHTSIYAGPVISYQGNQVPGTEWTWWATVTPVVQLSDVEGEPDFMVRAILGIEF